jgi:purine-binding chemotaxis protein CheW
LSKGTLVDAVSDQSKQPLQILTSGTAKFALFTRDIAAIVDWRMPTPLPLAPPAVLGVVSIQGRMLTVLDPAIVLDESTTRNGSPQLIVALRGDEQLGLIVDEKGEIYASDVRPQPAGTNGIVLGFIDRQDDAIKVLDVTKLFALAIRGRERRQRRF